jgi:hypothetical protein
MLAVPDDGPAAAAARNEFWTRRFDLAGVMVHRAVARGEVPVGTDPRLVLELLVAPFLFRVLATGESLRAGLAHQLADLVVRAFSRPP